MPLSVIVEQSGSEYEACVVGVPTLRARGASKTQALEAVRLRVVEEVERGRLFELDVPQGGGIRRQAGAYADDPYLSEICREAYADRDADRDGYFQ